MAHMVGTHWISTHRGPEDRERFTRWNPAVFKTVTIDEKVPYLEDVPAGALLLIRNHPLSELYDDRGFQDELVTPTTHEARYNDYFTAWTAKLIAARAADPANLLARPARGVALSAPRAGARAIDPITHARIHGIEAADACRRMANYCNANGFPDARLLFEGLNEPMLWSTEPPHLTAAYYLAFLNRLHGHGLHGAVGCFGIGWPGNGGATGAPPEWAFFKPVIDAMLLGDYLALHEYWALNGPVENWTWWAGRFLQCPYDVPILITECGIDTGVTGNWFGGWMDLPGTFEEKAERYVEELYWYVARCKADGRVKAITPFSYDFGSSHWQRFDLRNQSWLNAFFARAPIEPPTGGIIIQPPVEPPPPPPVGETIIEWTPTVSVAPQMAGNWFDGHVTLDSNPVDGAMVVFSWQPDGEWATKEARTGPHEGYQGWAHGFYSHIINVGTPRAGNWYVWLVDLDGKRKSPIAHFATTGSGNGPNQAQVNFVGITKPVIAVDLRTALLDAGEKNQVIQYNPDAALQKAIFRDGFVPNSGEFPVTNDGNAYVGQRAERLSDGVVRVYFCLLNDWTNVRHEQR